ncbi:serine protease [Streptomyces scopuliridis]|uniref:Serine protease n=1 Tax=Streptomyces scopuliridis TaxID=452529 RepID=A0ACD4ZJA9_9ACTN|nr:trypsin-like peptidase domain-containing protein [Streptomyces scopuliridis]WSB98126.1 serine protease [Streptomyces scopuliridis]WSC08172.1 serine protease [Streptomyces scopuliridis]
MTAHHAHPAPPLTLDDLARLDDLAAEEKAPDEVREGLATVRAPVTMPPGERLRLKDGGTFILPEGSFYGRAMTETELHEMGTLRAPDTPPRPHRPLWQPLLHYPRPTGPSLKMMRRINGTAVIPLTTGVYGEYPPRQTFFPSGFPWSCIGRIFIRNDAGSPNWDASGTAVLVGKRAVLTAAHAVPWGAPNASIQFVAGYFDGNSSAGAGGQSWATAAHGYAGQDVTAHDMAVLRLADPLGDWLGGMGARPFDDSWRGGAYWTSVGYPGDVDNGERPSFQSSIHVIDDDEDGDAQELEHHADETPGDSGGAFFGTWSDGPYAVGTVSGFEQVSGPLSIGNEDNNISAGGNALTGLVNFARTTWT